MCATFAISLMIGSSPANSISNEMKAYMEHQAYCESRAHIVASSNDFGSFWTIGIRGCGGSPRTNAAVFSWSLLLSLFAKLWIVEMYCSRSSPVCMVLFHKVCSLIHVGCSR
jgi:hypothetical protein